MQNWKKKLLNAAIKLDDLLDNQVFRLRQRLGSMDTIHVIPYRTYGTPGNIYVKGRVLEDKKIASGSKKVIYLPTC